MAFDDWFQQYSCCFWKQLQKLEKKKKVTDLVKKWSIGNLLLVSGLSGRQRQRVVPGKFGLVPCLPLFSWAFDRTLNQGLWDSEPYFLRIFLAILTLQNS